MWALRRPSIHLSFIFFLVNKRDVARKSYYPKFQHQCIQREETLDDAYNTASSKATKAPGNNTAQKTARYSILRNCYLYPRNGVLISWTAQVSCGKSEIVRCSLEICGPGPFEAQEKPVNGLLLPTLFCNRFYSSSKSCDIKRGDADGLVKSDAAKVGTLPTIVGTLLDEYVLPVQRVMDKWVEEGNEVTEAEVSLAFRHLRKRRKYVRALELLECLESSKHLDFDENYYASHVDLIAKVGGAIKAEEYIKEIPESFRGERVYGSLLANYVLTSNIKKSEELFN